jgi:hypothetical protein
LTKKKTGRPPLYSKELAQRICDLIASGETDAKIEAMDGMPSAQTIRRWRIDREDFCSNYARAREARADFRAERIDGYVQKVIDKSLPPDAARVAIDAEKWLAAKEQPKRYGDRIQVDGNMTVSMTDDQLESRISQLLGKAGTS